jgi:hypothetical protein
MTRPLSNDLRKGMVDGHWRRELPVGCGPIWRCGVVGGEVVATVPGDWFGGAGAGQDG